MLARFLDALVDCTIGSVTLLFWLLVFVFAIPFVIGLGVIVRTLLFVF